jgi:hypothetical protein
VTRALAILALAALAACTDDDPCAGAATCIRVDVHSATVSSIDQLELDVLYGDLHATTTTQATGGHTTQLPLATAIVLDISGADPIAVSIVAAGKLGANVLGAGAGSAAIAPHHHAAIDLELAPIEACTAGALYCGGDKLAGDPQVLYQCNTGGVPIARGRCAATCTTRPGKDDQCSAAGGTCRDGGTYCGGDKLAGDPQTLYTCMAGAATAPTPCASGCLVRTSDDDACR